ncbi:MAG TPA: type II toxin-antitoxin system VapC family toxin [Rhodoblastus sp.]|nr:type II toxin-antitoxin system VapC family toxin [Rhodoblastus sp.]
MIVVDSSAIVAIALDEPESEPFSRIISINRCLLAAPTALESHLVLSGRAPASAAKFMDVFLAREAVNLVPFDGDLLEIARHAFDRFGRGRHAAALNFGDCFAYALAKAHNAPLLYKGGDFALTDIRAAIPQGPT